MGEVHLEPAHVAELDRSIVESGRTRWTIFVRDSDGRCVGGTEVTFEPDVRTRTEWQLILREARQFVGS